jgi:hypothetical protein
VGFYGPIIFQYFQEQNELIQTNQAAALSNGTVLNLVTLGLTDACVDARAMAQGYPGIFAMSRIKFPPL